MRALLRAEGGTSEEQAEGAQAVFLLRVDERFKIDFVVAAGAGAGAAVVEAPDAAVGEDAPADAAVRADVGGGEIAQELGMGRAGAAAIVVVACVEGESEAFAFGDGEGVGVALGGEFGGGGAGLGVGVGEEQMVGDVLVAIAALLGQVFIPAEESEQRADQVLFGGGLVGVLVSGDFVQEVGQGGAEGVKVLLLRDRFMPGGGAADAFGQEVLGKELAGHGRGRGLKGSYRRENVTRIGRKCRIHLAMRDHCRFPGRFRGRVIGR